MGNIEGSALLVLLIAGLWLAIATALLVLAVRRIREAKSVIDAARSMASLLEAAPARPVDVRTDGSIEVDGRLLRELGLSDQALQWPDLVGNECVILEEDIDALQAATRSA